jgi:hypothetical protein
VTPMVASRTFDMLRRDCLPEAAPIRNVSVKSTKTMTRTKTAMSCQRMNRGADPTGRDSGCVHEADVEAEEITCAVRPLMSARTSPEPGDANPSARGTLISESTMSRLEAVMRRRERVSIIAKLRRVADCGSVVRRKEGQMRFDFR